MVEKSVLWLDLSSSCNGFAFIKDGQLIYSGVIKYIGIKPKDINYEGKKLALLEQAVIDLITKLNPTIIGCEDIFCKSVTGYKNLSKLQGIIQKVIYKLYPEKEVIKYIARTVRARYKLNVDKGTNLTERFPSINFEAYKDIKPKVKLQEYAVKIVVIDYVNNKFNKTLTFKENDEADAILGALYVYETTDWENI